MKKVILISGAIFLTILTFADNEVFDGQDVSGKNFSNSSLKNSSWRGVNCNYLNFENSDLTNANFNGATKVNTANFTNAIINGIYLSGGSSGLTKSQLYSTRSYKEKNLIGVTMKISSHDLTEQDLTGANFSGSMVSGDNWGAILTDATINNVDFSEVLGLREYQLYSTKSYKIKDLSGINFSNTNNRAGLCLFNFREQNLTNANFSGTHLRSTNFRGAALFNVNFNGAELSYAIFEKADLRGALYLNIIAGDKNTIWTDGEIKNFVMESVDDSLTIRAYVPATSGGAMINTKIVDDASISGGAVLTLEQGAVLEIASGKTLSVLDDSEIIFNVDAAASDATKVLLGENSKLAFGSDSKITINLEGVVSEDDPFSFSVVETIVGSQVLGTDSLKKENVILNVNGEEYDSSKWNFDFDSSTGALNINVNVPEPAEWAMIFGAVTLAFAAYRRRK